MSLKDTDVRTPGDQAIAKKWKLNLAKVRSLVKQGAKHEKEHNTNLAKAEEVARDHINERPDYYKMLKKAEKTKVSMKEETGVGSVRGLGFVTGDPGVNPISQYINTNAMSYVDENGNKLEYIKKQHADLHNKGLGHNFFDPTKIKSSSNFMKEERLNELGGMVGYEGINDKRSLRTNDQLEEGPKLDKAKKIAKTVAVTGMTAANMYTMGDAISQHKPRHQTDMVRAATALPGAAGWGASAVHYGKKGYDLAKASLKKKAHMEEEKKMSNPCWKGYKAYGMKKKDGKEVPNCVPVEEATDKDHDLSKIAGAAIDKGHAVKKLPAGRAQNAVLPKKSMPKGFNLERGRWSGHGSFTEENVEESAAWQRSAGKDPEGGLNRKGIASYRREHPGSKLSMAVTTEPSKLKPGSKAANRRKSFCARMGGMKGPMKDEKGRPTRKALALRKWNCEEETKYPDTAERGIYEKAPPGAKYERMVRHIKAGYAKDGLTKKEKGIAFATAWKAKNKEKLDEISAELVGKVSNARWRRGEAPSKTLTRAINKKFIESGKKKETKKQVKENSKDKDWDISTGPMGKGDMAEQTPAHLHLNKPDTAYAPGAAGTTKTIYEETKMENQNLINEAIENILENDLVTMKENFMAALQEKAQEKLEERKKIIASEYFAQ